MKRARGKNNKYDDIYVPQMIYNQNTYSSVSKTRKKKSKKKKNGRHNLLKAVLILILLAIAAFFFAMGMGWSNGGGDEGALIPVDMEKGKLNVLLLGVDEDGLRTDAIMLVSYDLNEAGAKLISIPRDTQIRVLDRNVTRKINEIHAMHNGSGNILGPLGSVKVVQSITSIPIHYYIEFSFDAIDEIADILGGIKFDVPDIEGSGMGMNYDDPVQNLHIHLKPGLQVLKGNQVQQFLRYRKSNSNTQDGSDTSRVERQHEFIKAAVAQKVNLSLIAKLPSIYSKIKKNVKTNFSSADIIKYSRHLNGLTSEAIQTFSLPGESKHVPSGWYFICDLNLTGELIRSEFDYDAESITNQITISDIEGTKKILSSSSGKNQNSAITQQDNRVDEKNAQVQQKPAETPPVTETQQEITQTEDNSDTYEETDAANEWQDTEPIDDTNYVDELQTDDDVVTLD